MFLRILLNSLIPPLKDYEKVLFDNLINKLASKAGSQLAKQIESINYVQRHANKKEVTLYTIKNNKPFFNEKYQFFLNLPEVKLASIIFKDSVESENFHADFWLVNGYIFSIEFDKSPSKIKNSNIDIKTIQVFVDPMKKE